MKLVIKLLGLGIISLMAAAAFVGYYQYEQFRKTPLNITEQNALLDVAPGTNVRRLARQLQQDNILLPHAYLSNDLVFAVHARLTEKASKIKAGQYQLEAGMTPDALLDLLVSGKTVQYQLAIIEGHTFKELIRKIKQHPNLEQTLSDGDYAAIMTRLGAEGTMHPEGWFYPDTYSFPAKTTDLAFLERSYKAMTDYLQQAWEARVPHPGIKTPYEALIMASIVEKETGVPEERPLIARVFLNRLEKGMLLQTDPTIIYGLGDDFDGNLTKKHLKQDQPYNSYTRKGLPPTPIATPSKAAIDAVFHPVDSDALYFVADGSGGHYFSKTYREHRKAVIKYQLRGNASRYQGDK